MEAFYIKKISIAKFISIGIISSAIAITCQAAPVFIPSTGLALSPLSTLPIALVTFYNISLGSIAFFSSALILTLISTQEALIFLLTTGLLGIVIGVLAFKKKLLNSILYSSIMLFLGMTYLNYIMDILVLGDFINSLSIPLTLLIFLIFSFIYSSIWNILFKKLIFVFRSLKKKKPL